MFDMTELVSEDGIGFLGGENVQQAAGDYNASIATCTAEGKCVGCAAVDDPKARDFESALSAKLFNELAVGIREFSTLVSPGDVQNPLNDVGRDQVLEADECHGEDNGEP